MFISHWYYVSETVPSPM